MKDIHEGVVYAANEVKVTAFLVDHAPVSPAFGYRIDYRGRSVVLSGDTKPSDNLVKFSQGVDVLIHEVGRWKQDPVFDGPPGELIPGTRATRGQGQDRRAASYRRRGSRPDIRASEAKARRVLPLQRRPCGHASAREADVRGTRSIRRRPDDYRDRRPRHGDAFYTAGPIAAPPNEVASSRLLSAAVAWRSAASSPSARRAALRERQACRPSARSPTSFQPPPSWRK